jgi:hypothetical protein
VTEVLARLRAEANQDGTLDRFDALKGYLVSAAADKSYASAATTLGLSEAAVKSAIFRLRRRYGEILRESIANTVASPEEVDDEIRYLFSSLAE